MAGIRSSARVINVTAKCGHPTLVMLPPGELGAVGQQNISKVQGGPCWKCREKEVQDGDPGKVS